MKLETANRSPILSFSHRIDGIEKPMSDAKGIAPQQEVVFDQLGWNKLNKNVDPYSVDSKTENRKAMAAFVRQLTGETGG
jgi:hypothetical protein